MIFDSVNLYRHNRCCYSSCASKRCSKETNSACSTTPCSRDPGSCVFIPGIANEHPTSNVHSSCWGPFTGSELADVLSRQFGREARSIHSDKMPRIRWRHEWMWLEGFVTRDTQGIEHGWCFMMFLGVLKSSPRNLDWAATGAPSSPLWRAPLQRITEGDSLPFWLYQHPLQVRTKNLSTWGIATTWISDRTTRYIVVQVWKANQLQIARISPMDLTCVTCMFIPAFISGNCRDLASLFGHVCLVRLLPFDGHGIHKDGIRPLMSFVESRSLWIARDESMELSSQDW